MSYHINKKEILEAYQKINEHDSLKRNPIMFHDARLSDEQNSMANAVDHNYNSDEPNIDQKINMRAQASDAREPYVDAANRLDITYGFLKTLTEIYTEMEKDDYDYKAAHRVHDAIYELQKSLWASFGDDYSWDPDTMEDDYEEVMNELHRKSGRQIHIGHGDPYGFDFKHFGDWAEYR